MLSILDTKIPFPPSSEAMEDGLLSLTFEITPERVKEGYNKGIFAWIDDGELIFWFAPKERFVIYSDSFRIGKSAQKLLKRKDLDFKVNENFSEVIYHCAMIERSGQEETWISDRFIATYKKLNEEGLAYSFEVYRNRELVGGLYGVLIGNVFFGESMFSLESGMSKYAFVKAYDYLKEKDIKLIDCQIYSDYLHSFGAETISREMFENHLKEWL